MTTSTQSSPQAAPSQPQSQRYQVRPVVRLSTLDLMIQHRLLIMGALIALLAVSVVVAQPSGNGATNMTSMATKATSTPESMPTPTSVPASVPMAMPALTVVSMPTTVPAAPTVTNVCAVRAAGYAIAALIFDVKFKLVTMTGCKLVGMTGDDSSVMVVMFAGDVAEYVALGRAVRTNADIAAAKRLAAREAVRLNDTVDGRVVQAYTDALYGLEGNMPALNSLADELSKRKTIDYAAAKDLASLAGIQ